MGYLLVSQKISPSGVIEFLERLSFLNLSVCLLLALLQVGFQSSRLWMMLAAAKAPMSWLQVFKAFSFGQLINDFVPARAGDVAKVAFLKRVAHDKSLTLTKIAGSVFIADKFADICALIFWSALGGQEVVQESFREKDLTYLTYIASTLGVIVFSLAAFLVFRRKSKLAHHVLRLIRSVTPFLRSRYLVLGLTFAVLAWLMEIANIRFLSAAIGYDISFSASLAVIILLNIGIAVPVSIANIGTFEAAMAFGLTRMGVPISAAIAIASVHHIIQVGAVVFSAIAMWLWRGPIREDKGTEAFAAPSENKECAIQHY